MEKSDNPKRCCSPVVRKTAIYGSVISIFLTISAMFCGGLYGLLFVSMPLVYLGNIFDFNILTYYDSVLMQLFVYVILPTLINAILLFMVGIFIGWLIQKLKTKN
jgi:hypothetical protein